MRQVLIQGGNAVVTDVPAPTVGKWNVLVSVEYSCVSVGTEMASVRVSGLPLYKRALKQPENVRRVIKMVKDEGLRHTFNRVAGKLAAGTPTGYSAAGTVIAVGSEVSGFSVGDKVACAGAGIANHAEIIDVPVNLAVLVPKDVPMHCASSVTLGAIALQGVRRAAPTLGECIVVVGLGLLGQLTAQMLRANGCRVIGVDPDARRRQQATEHGLDVAIDPSSMNYVERVLQYSNGFGADGVIVTAATSSDEVISFAMQACRRKGRVVLVGDVGLGLRREDFYRKELDFLISTSYGPGRYDPRYEEEGQDYPIGYVRWTENRNMSAYLDLLQSSRVSLEGFFGEHFGIDQATAAYAMLNAPGDKPLMVFLEYPHAADLSPAGRRVQLRSVAKSTGRVGVAIAGASSFAQGVHLPNLKKLKDDFQLRAVMSRTGSNARQIASQFGAGYCTTDFNQILQDPDVQLVVIATRHDLHAGMALEALRAGKHVLVEKPLALSEQQLTQIEDFYSSGKPSPMLMVGYNRRFAPAVESLSMALRERTTPLVVNYRMNAGFIPREHWVHGPEGGGRNLGEACHIYDLFLRLCGGGAPTHLHATSITPSGAQWAANDNFVATMKFRDGSVCTLTYTALGDKSYPKERMDVFADGKVFSLDEYKELRVAGARQSEIWSSQAPRKGHLEELQALAAAIRGGGPWPISLDDLMASARISFEVENFIKG